MNDQDQNSTQEKPVYLNELDDGTRRRAQKKGAAVSPRRKIVKNKAPRSTSQGNRFLISMLLFLFVALAGLAALLLTGKIVLPI